MNTKQKPMRSVWHSLLWKEWHEHKWKLVGLIALVLVLWGMLCWVGDGMPLETASMVLACYCFLAALFLGMHTAGGENGRGTMSFLQTLPVTMRKPAAIRLLMSWGTVVIPVLVILGLAYASLKWQNFSPAELAEMADWFDRLGPFSGWGFQNPLTGLGLGGALFVTSLLLWMVAGGVNRADEISAGAIGFLTIAIVWFCLGGLAYQAEKLKLEGLKYGIYAAMIAAPGGPLHLGNLARESHMPLTVLAAIAIVGHACVLTWYLRRFGRKTVRPARTLGGQVKATKSDWLAPPRRSQLTAILWKQVHETGPLALMAAAAVLVMSALGFWINRDSSYRNNFGEMLGGITVSAGFLVTVVAGAGVFLEDLKPKVGIFWRSRPINTTQWFFVKFFTGLAVLVVTFGALFLIAYFLILVDRNPLRSFRRAGRIWRLDFLIDLHAVDGELLPGASANPIGRGDVGHSLLWFLCLLLCLLGPVWKRPA